MKAFLQHMIKERLNTIVENSYLNYGIKGLHCIDILSGTDYGVKLYFTETNHDMQNNLPQQYHNGITLPFSQYNRNIKIQMLKGSIILWQAKRNDFNCSLLTNEYFSHYDNGVHEYTLVKEHVGLETASVCQLSNNQVFNIKANELYTIGCGFGTSNAWLVFEGRATDEPSYNVYTNADIKSMPYLYLRPDKNEVLAILDKIGILK